ncbi:hypothetical protein BKA70DRAFT_1227044 [Coprinopsis sp. MPI-PUGE-AT-0042]|nr:hypothetical protein BKA70DRAFT_1227044 [Coprinopsis sp. MPI-PUGE-AT-0042]
MACQAFIGRRGRGTMSLEVLMPPDVPEVSQEDRLKNRASRRNRPQPTGTSRVETYWGFRATIVQDLLSKPEQLMTSVPKVAQGWRSFISGLTWLLETEEAELALPPSQSFGQHGCGITPRRTFWNLNLARTVQMSVALVDDQNQFEDWNNTEIPMKSRERIGLLASEHPRYQQPCHRLPTLACDHNYGKGIKRITGNIMILSMMNVTSTAWSQFAQPNHWWALSVGHHVYPVMEATTWSKTPDGPDDGGQEVGVKNIEFLSSKAEGQAAARLTGRLKSKIAVFIIFVTLTKVPCHISRLFPKHGEIGFRSIAPTSHGKNLSHQAGSIQPDRPSEANIIHF